MKSTSRSRKPVLPYTDREWREAIPLPLPVTPYPNDVDYGLKPLFPCKVIPVYTKEQMEEYGRKMMIYGFEQAMEACDAFDTPHFAYRPGVQACITAIRFHMGAVLLEQETTTKSNKGVNNDNPSTNI